MGQGCIALPPDGSGKKVPTHTFAWGAEPTVHAQGLFICDSAGNVVGVTGGRLLVDPGPVSVNNFPAVQPVSGTVIVGNLPGTQPVSASSLPLPAGAAQEHATATSWHAVRLTDGTAYLATTNGRLQVSDGGVALGSDVTDRVGRLLGHVQVDNFPGTQPVSGPLTDAQLRASAVSTRDVKDAGRTYVVLSAAGTASVMAETALALNQNKAGTASSGASYTVTTGKTFRLQALQFGSRFTTPSTTVTFANVTFRLRLTNATGALVLQDSKMSASNMPTPNSDLTIPDGLEFPAGTVLVLTQQASAATLSVDALLVGYEF